MVRHKKQYNRFKHLITIFGMLLGIITTEAVAKANSNQVQGNNTNEQNYQNVNQNDVQSSSPALISNNTRPDLNQSRSSMYRNNLNDNQVSGDYHSQFSESINNQANQIKNNILNHIVSNNQWNNHNYRSTIRPDHVTNRFRHGSNHSLRYRHFKSTNNYEYHPSYHYHYRHHNWFRDGLSRKNFQARKWVSWHESGHRWRVLSYGHVCVGYFQLNPSYLGYKHGHVNLNRKHQVKVADYYVRLRYGNWVNAKRFWEAHHWY